MQKPEKKDKKRLREKKRYEAKKAVLKSKREQNDKL